MQFTTSNPSIQLSLQQAQHLQTQKWYAWIPLQPLVPKKLFITGEVEGHNAGMQVSLLKKKDACRSDLLCLELIFRQIEGDWPALSCWLKAQYQEVIFGSHYNMVQIFVDNRLIEKFPIDLITT